MKTTIPMYLNHTRIPIKKFADYMMKIKNPYFKNIEIDAYRLEQLLKVQNYREVGKKQYYDHDDINDSIRHIYGITTI